MVHGILFKFTNDNLGLYNGIENANKASSLDLLGCASVLGSPVSEVHVPLMCVIDYRGFRVTAMTLIPIRGTETLIYGSNDACKTDRNDDEVFDKCMEHLASHLNFKQHQAGNTSLWTAADVEGHLGFDGRYYKRLRPELVRSIKFPLSSDAFSRFGLHDGQIHDSEVLNATSILHKYEITRFCYWLSIQDKFALEIFPFDPDFNLSFLLHSFGINVRHCFQVYHTLLVLGNLLPPTNQVDLHYVEVMKATVEFQGGSNSTTLSLERIRNWAGVILIEMVARSVKSIVRRDLRIAMEKLARSADEPYKQIIISHLNWCLLQLTFIKRYQKFESRAKAM